jgi:hypothetical protein
MVEAAADADALALVERYHALVAACRREADAQHESAEGPVELDLSTVDVAIGTDRFAALPMAALAAAAGCASPSRRGRACSLRRHCCLARTAAS